MGYEGERYWCVDERDIQVRVVEQSNEV
jgi:hypothetical protein